MGVLQLLIFMSGLPLRVPLNPWLVFLSPPLRVVFKSHFGIVAPPLRVCSGSRLFVSRRLLRGSGRFFYVADVFSFRVGGGLKLSHPPLRVVGDSKVFVYCRLRVSEPCRVLTSLLHPPLRGWPNSWSSDQCIGRRPTAALDNMTYVFRCGCFNGKDGPSLRRGLSLVARLRLSYTPRLS